MLLAEGKNSDKEYNVEEDQWTTNDTVLGHTGVILKSTGDGWLYIRLTSAGFQWEHGRGSYRHIGRSAPNTPQLKMVDSSTRKFEVHDVQELLQEQAKDEYGEGDKRYDFPVFAKRIF